MKILLATLPLLLLIIAIAVYATYKKPVEPIITIAPTVIDNVRATTTPAPVQPVSNPPSSVYIHLPENEKRIIDRFAEKNPDVYQMILDGHDDEVYAKSTILLKYYDDKIAVLSVPSGKGYRGLDVYNINTFDILNKNHMDLLGSFIEGKNYILTIEGDHIVYYKKGETDFVTIPESQLSDKETYVKTTGIMSGYDFMFDENTKEIKASVFKPVFDLVKENPKIRTATFVLP